MMNRLCVVAALSLAVGLVGCSHDHDHDHKHHHHHHDRDGHSDVGGLEAPMMAQAAVATPSTQPAAKLVTAGAPITLAGTPVPVSEVLAHPEKYAAGPIKIAGNVSSVCVKKGCWARLTDEKTPAGQDLFVKFDCPESDDGRVLPMSVKGNPAVVEGTVKVSEMSEAKARHYAKDAGLPEAEVNKIVGPQKQVTVMSPAVQVSVKE